MREGAEKKKDIHEGTRRTTKGHEEKPKQKEFPRHSERQAADSCGPALASTGVQALPQGLLNPIGREASTQSQGDRLKVKRLLPAATATICLPSSM